MAGREGEPGGGAGRGNQTPVTGLQNPCSVIELPRQARSGPGKKLGGFSLVGSKGIVRLDS